MSYTTNYSTLPASPLRGAKRLSLTFTKAQTVAGRVLYDAFGGVLTRTMPLTGSGGLTTTLSPAMIDLLAGQGTTDPDTDLVYLGNGRYFDPLLGLPLQPNPIGGAPTVPQSLNRYAATSLGPPGVAEGTSSDFFLRSWLRDNWYRQGASSFTACATCVLSEIKRTEQLFRLRVTIGPKTFTGQELFRQIGQDTFQNTANGNIWTREQFLVGVFEPAELEVRWTGSRNVDNALKNILAKSSRRIALNLGVAAVLDVGFEGLEYATGTGRWGNPYWTPDQKLRQTGTAIGGDLVIVGVIAWWNPELWPGIATYFGASLIWSYIHPIIFPGQFEENRNLAPLRQ